MPCSEFSSLMPLAARAWTAVSSGGADQTDATVGLRTSDLPHAAAADDGEDMT